MNLNSKAKFSLVIFALLFLADNGRAIAEDVLVLENEPASKYSEAWPMLPGDSLRKLAAKMHPDSKVMQGHFVNKALSLNSEAMPNLNPDADFKAPVTIFIPTNKMLTASAQDIKEASKSARSTWLRMSYNMNEEVKKLPPKLSQEYQDLESKNQFLAAELAKANHKLEGLQNKFKELKITFEKTFDAKQKLPAKDLNEKPANKQAVQKPVEAKPAPSVFESNIKPNIEKLVNFLTDPSSQNVWLSALGLCLAGLLSGFLLKSYRQKVLNKLSELSSQAEATLNLKNWIDTTLVAKETEKLTSLGADTMVGEQSTSDILEEAKLMVSKGQPNEAIEHLKWAMRAKPKKAINLWFYILQIFREQNLKDDFENYAKAMHQTFNVMTPVWEEKSIAIVVAQSLEEFPHIIERLTGAWPSESADAFLRGLIYDNRDGERTGFGRAVVDEILLLIAVLESRN